MNLVLSPSTKPSTDLPGPSDDSEMYDCAADVSYTWTTLIGRAASAVKGGKTSHVTRPAAMEETARKKAAIVKELSVGKSRQHRTLYLNWFRSSSRGNYAGSSGSI